MQCVLSITQFSEADLFSVYIQKGLGLGLQFFTKCTKSNEFFEAVFVEGFVDPLFTIFHFPRQPKQKQLSQQEGKLIKDVIQVSITLVTSSFAFPGSIFSTQVALSKDQSYKSRY